MDKIEMIVNPLTNRTIKINGKVHKKLIREGVMKGILEKDEAILYDYNENDDVEYLKEELNKKLPMRKKAVKGRAGSQYENKIVSRSRTPNTKEIVDYTLSTIKNHSKLDADIEQMIMNELCFDNKKISKPINIKKEKASKNKKQQSKVQFKIIAPDTETEYETEYDDESEINISDLSESETE